MFQLDTRIPLGSQQPQQSSGSGLLGRLEQMQAQRELSEQRRLANEQRQRQLDDDDAIRRTLPNYSRPDDAIEDLYRQGRPSAAAALSKNVFDYRKSQADVLKTSLDNNFNKLKMATQIYQGVDNQNSHESAAKAIGALLGPEMAAHLGPTYDPKRKEEVLAWGTTRAEQLRAQQDAVDNANKAVELGLRADGSIEQRAKNRLEARDYWNKYLSNMESTATNQEQWDHYKELGRQGGAPDDLLQGYGDWSADAPARAKKLGLTGAEEASIENSAAIRKQAEATQKATEQYHRDMIDQRVKDRDARGAAAGGSPTAREQRDIDRWEANQNSDLEARWRGTVSNPGPGSGPPGTDEYNRSLQDLRTQKLRVKDAARQQYGLKPLLATEYELAHSNDPAKATDLRKIRNEYKKLMGEQTPLEQIQAVFATFAADYKHLTGKDLATASQEDRKANLAKFPELAAQHAKYSALRQAQPYGQ